MKSIFGFGLVVAFVLGGCGGGGSGGTSGPVASTKSFDVKTAHANYVSTSPRTYNLSGSAKISGVDYSVEGKITEGALAAGTFEGQTVIQQTGVLDLVYTNNGNSFPRSISDIDYYSSSDYSFLGGSSTTHYQVVEPGGEYPAAAKVGDSGNLFTSKIYSDSTKSTLIANRVRSYSVTVDTAESVIFVINITETEIPSGNVLTGTNRIRITSAGTATTLSQNVADSNGNFLNLNATTK